MNNLEQPETQYDSSKQQDESPKQPSDTNFKLVKSYFKGHFKSSLKDLGFYFLFSFAKYVACFWCLRNRADNCEVNPLSVWLTVVGMYEFFNSIRYLTILYSLCMNQRDVFLLIASDFVTQELKLSNDDLQPKDSGTFINKRNQLKIILQMKMQMINTIKLQKDPPFSSYEIIYQAEALNKYTKLMRIYNQSVFYLVFIGGNAAYLASENIQKVTFVLLLIGYLFSAFLIVGFGLALLSMGLYIPVVIFVFLIKYVGVLIKKIQLKNKYKNLITFNYKAKSEYMNQCLICQIDYSVGDKVLQLRCHSKHNFHQACIHQWFQIKQQCPVCRQNL